MMKNIFQELFSWVLLQSNSVVPDFRSFPLLLIENHTYFKSCFLNADLWNIIEITLNMKLAFVAALSLLGFANGLQCEQGSIPDARNVCIRPKYIEGCYKYASEKSCAECNFNYKLDNSGMCSYSPQSTESCCLERFGGACRKCNKGMTLLDGSCVMTESFGCLEKAVNGTCTNCASDYVLVKGNCLLGIRNCQKYTDASRKFCESCYPSYSLAANLCVKNKILGCKIEGHGECTECYPPFKPADGHCEIKHCKDYNDFGCESCECGFYITSGRVCQKMDEGCLRYQKGACTDCMPPFNLQGTSCVLDGCSKSEGKKCSSCSSGYKLERGECVLPNCEKGRNGKCEICKSGFRYNNGECVSDMGERKVFNEK